MQFTQREFLYLDDVMAGEKIGIMQFQDLALHCTDPQLKDLCQQIASQNVQHFNRLARLLDQGQGGQSSYNANTNTAPSTQWGSFSGQGFPQQ